MSDRPGPSARVLVVDDEPSLRQMMQVLLKRVGHEVVLAEDVKTAREILASAPAPFDLVVTDLVMPDGSGLEVLDAVRASTDETQVLVVTAHASLETAIEAMRRGAYGYVEKPISVVTARAQVEKALEKRLLLRDNAQLRALARQTTPGEVPLIGRSPALHAALDLLRRAAPARASVLITGESGTGKEVFARALHTASDRADEPFVVINCGAIPEALMESELFGHEKGSFTGADRKREGLFQQADKGTLFLDEIGELPPQLQPKLLRAIQARKVRPVGANVEREVNVRVVAATNRDLEAEVRAGRFRQDLFYRLNVLRLHLPPLRERREDLPLLVEHFRARFAAEHGRPHMTLAPEALRALLAYDFPGNVRELENALERAVTLARGNTLQLADLPPEVLGRGGAATPLALLPPEGLNLEQFLADLERAFLEQALARTNGVRTRAANLLGLTFRSFRYRLAKMGLASEHDVEETEGAESAGRRPSRPEGQ